MNKILKYVGAAIIGILTIASCSPDDYGTVNPDGIPTIEGVTPVITVDQTINQVTFSLPADMKGVMPIWIIDGTTYSTVNGLKKIYTKAGDYQVELKLMNKNGISDGSVTATFHIDNTVFDFTRYITLLCGGTENSSKEWRMQNEVAGHMGCGPAGTTGTEWWSAGVDDKKGVGIYDNRLIFGSDHSYTFNPGEAGTMYVNKGVTGIWTDHENADNDYNVPMAEKKTNFEFDVVGEDLFITLPSQTPFLYVPYADSWTSPRFKVESITGSTLNLIADNGSIAWHFTLTSGAAEVAFNGFKYASEFNIWKPIDDASSYTTSFWYAPGWTQIADPGFAQNGSEYTFTLPSATTDQWQAQCFIIPNTLALSAGTKYDFSCILNSSTDNAHVTLKLTDKTNDGNYVFVETIALKAYEDYVFYLSDVNNMTADADCKLVIDFGGNGENCTATVKNITLKDHANDDGTILPKEEEPATVTWREADNLLKNLQFTKFFYYAPGWNQIADPALTEKDGSYTLALPSATYDRWQAQFHMKNTGVALSADKKYDFRVVFNSSTDIKGVSIKLAQDDDDNTFILDSRADLTAYNDYTFEGVNLEGKDISNLKIVFDFGGNPDGSEITISKILLQEHAANAEELTWDAAAGNNLWTESLSPNFFYYAPGWSQIADPTVTQNGRTVKLSLPTATTDQWQAQVAWKETGISTKANEKYDFQVLLTPNQNLNGVTVKLVKDGDDNTFYFTDRINLSAYETYTFRYVGMAGIDMDKVNLFLDFGGNPANTEIEVSDIILRKH